jgi:hypothetical protein
MGRSAKVGRVPAIISLCLRVVNPIEFVEMPVIMRGTVLVSTNGLVIVVLPADTSSSPPYEMPEHDSLPYDLDLVN